MWYVTRYKTTSPCCKLILAHYYPMISSKNYTTSKVVLKMDILWFYVFLLEVFVFGRCRLPIISFFIPDKDTQTAPRVVGCSFVELCECAFWRFPYWVESEKNSYANRIHKLTVLWVMLSIWPSKTFSVVLVWLLP